MYRRDIDGLRAIAVSSVVLAHAQIQGFSGGFLGVDVFFVISGYLITGILLKDASLGRPSLLHFYERRIRRIVPALVVVLAASTGAALGLFSPYELKNFADGLIASTAFVANLFFMAGTDYCSPRYEEPLLHLWSLGVEEQFYIAFPVFLWWLLRLPAHRRLQVLVGLFVVSLGFSELFAELLPKYALADLIPGFEPGTAAFYFTGSRAWELLIGAMVALRTPVAGPASANGGRLPAFALEILAIVGLLAILIPVVFNSRETPWPGIHAIAPCLGTALLIALHERHSTVVARLLSTPPLVGLGLISYSLYLWHWPLFEFYRRWSLQAPSISEYVILILAALVVAIFSWRFVEQPLRHPQHRISKETVFRAAAVWGGVFLCAGIAVFVGAGFPGRFSPAVQGVYATLDGNAAIRRTVQNALPRCYVRNHGPDYSFERCFRLSRDKPNVVIWGDSFVGNYFYGFHDAGLKSGVNVIEASHFDCRPVLDEHLVTHRCAVFNRAIAAHLDQRITAVVISARLLNHQELVPAVLATAREIARRSIKVIVIGASLEYREAEPFYVARYVQTGNARWLDSRAFLKPGLIEFDKKLRALFQDTEGIRYVSVLDTVCAEGRCPMMVGGAPMQSDFGHLTMAGSMVFGAALWSQVHAFALSGFDPGKGAPTASAVSRASATIQ
ncbi:MAG: acyltransferase family protein [Formivibrio sp.]|nr:acyltransferase family protein [Formivibrio sp.]